MGRDRPRLQLRDAGLFFGAGGDAAWDRPPVVEDLRDVVDPVGALGDPQHELEVLDLVEGRVEAPGGLGDRGADDQQVADVHRPQRVDRRPVRLQERVGADAADRQLVAVAVDDVELGVGGERLGDPQQRVRGQRVVVVEEADELALAQRQARRWSRRRFRRSRASGLNLIRGWAPS